MGAFLPALKINQMIIPTISIAAKIFIVFNVPVSEAIPHNVTSNDSKPKEIPIALITFRGIPGSMPNKKPILLI